MATGSAWNCRKPGITLPETGAPCRSAEREQPGRWPHKSHGGIMRIRRAIVIPALLALSVTGSVVAGLAMSAAVRDAPSAGPHVDAGAAKSHRLHRRGRRRTGLGS